MSRAHPEHDLQIQINKWVRAHVAQPHLFLSVDRAAATGRFTHAREKARGVVAGTPDTLLTVPGHPLIAVELKSPGNEPTDRQREVGAAIVASGHRWDWCDSVEGYAEILRRYNVPLVGRWDVTAQHYDALLAAKAIQREESKTGKPSRARATKPSASRIRKTEKIRSEVLF